MTRVLIAASGTGGHIFPALAVADAFPPDWQVQWLGVPDRLETSILPDRYQLSTIAGGGLQGNLFRKIFSCLQLFASTFGVVNLLKKRKIDVVFSTGGYIAAPAIMAASICRIPIVVHESNAQPGKVVKLMGRFCDVVALGFAEASFKLNRCRTVFTGTPVRSSFLTYKELPPWAPSGEGPLIVVMGGSQGALGLNKMVRSITPKLLELGCRIVHLTGPNDSESMQYFHPNLIEREFSDDIPSLLQNADLAISRAGASAISELAICGTASILVPYPQAKDKHQEVNAMNVASKGAAVVIHQTTSNKKVLLDVILNLFHFGSEEISQKKEKLFEMKKAMKSLSIVDSNQKLAELIQKLL